MGTEMSTSNKQLVSMVKLRATVLAAVRQYFADTGATEADIPQVIRYPDLELTFEMFTTRLDQGSKQFPGFLISSAELQMKQLIAAGSGDIYWLGHCFRNDELLSSRHNPEYTSLEWYRVDQTYQDLMDNCEAMVKFVVKRVIESKFDHGKKLDHDSLSYQDQSIDLSLPWERLSIVEAFARYAHISEEQLFNESKLIKVAKSKGYAVTKKTKYADVFYQILLHEIEPHLGMTRPTFLYDYPRSEAPLAKIKESDPRVAERFELYIGCLELANAFTEITDWRMRDSRMRQQQQERVAQQRASWQIDQQFMDALKKNSPDCAGIGFGIDRLLMILADKASIDDVLTFPVSKLFSS